MEVGRRAVGAMPRGIAALRAAAAAASVNSSASSTRSLLQGPMPLSRATRYGFSLPLPRTGGYPRIAPRSEIGFVPGCAIPSFGGRPMGIRAFSTFGRHNRDKWNAEKFRYYLFHMFEYFKSVIAENHTAAILNIERNRSELFAELHICFQTAMWKLFGAVSAALSAAVSIAYILYDKRSEMSENHFNRRMDTQDRKIEMMRLLMVKLENAECTADPAVFFVKSDLVTEGSFILINDSPCKVNLVKNQATESNEMMVKYICRDISSGQCLELQFPKSYIVKGPIVTAEDYELLNTCFKGSYVTILSKTKGNKDIRIPSDLVSELSGLRASGVYVTVVSAVGREFVTGVKEVEKENRPHWIRRFF